MSVRQLPDVEELLWRWLTAHDDVEPVIGDRVYTVLPANKVYPLVRLERVAIGGPLLRSLIPLERVVVEFHVLAPRTAAAHDAGRLIRSVLPELEGAALELNGEAAVFSRIELGGMGHQVDPDLMGPTGGAMHDYRWTTYLDVRPAPAAGP